MKRFLQRILQEIMKKKIKLGTSDAWLLSRLSQRSSDPATQHIILKIVGFLVVYTVFHIFNHLGFRDTTKGQSCHQQWTFFSEDIIMDYTVFHIRTHPIHEIVKIITKLVPEK